MDTASFKPNDRFALFHHRPRNCTVEVVFVHPETNDVIADHTEHAIWLGDKLDLDIDALSKR